MADYIANIGGISQDSGDGKQPQAPRGGILDESFLPITITPPIASTSTSASGLVIPIKPDVASSTATAIDPTTVLSTITLDLSSIPATGSSSASNSIWQGYFIDGGEASAVSSAIDPTFLYGTAYINGGVASSASSAGATVPINGGVASASSSADTWVIPILPEVATAASSASVYMPQVDCGAVSAASSCSVNAIFMVIPVTEYGDIILPKFAVSGVGHIGGVGEASLSSSFEASGTGFVEHLGEGSLALPDIEVIGTGALGASAYGSLRFDLDAVQGSGLTGEAGSASLTLPNPTATGNNTENAGTGEVELPQPSATGEGISGATATASLELPTLQVAASGPGAIPGAGDGQGSGGVLIPRLSLVGVGVAGFLGTADLTLPDLKVRGISSTAEDGTGTGAITLPRFAVEGYGGIETTGIASLTIPKFTVNASGATEVYSTYFVSSFAMNIEKYGVSVYNNYPVNSSCSMSSTTYAALNDGIYTLGGDTDHGEPIDSNIQKIGMSMNSTLLKRATDVYLRLRSDGDYSFKIVADGVERVQPVSDPLTGLHSKKVNLPKGLKGRRIGVGVASPTGSDITVENMELIVQELTRRGRR